MHSPTDPQETLVELGKAAIVFVFVWSALMLFASNSNGATCAQHVACNVQKRVAVKHVAAVQAIAYPPVYYAVAPHLQDRAVIRYEVKEAVKEALAELQQPLARQHACQECGEQVPHGALSSELPPPSHKPMSVLAANCAKCHGGESPKKNFSVDVELTDETRAKIARKILADEMPVDGDGNPKPLTNEAKSQLLFELFGSGEPSASFNGKQLPLAEVPKGSALNKELDAARSYPTFTRKVGPHWARLRDVINEGSK